MQSIYHFIGDNV